MTERLPLSPDVTREGVLAVVRAGKGAYGKREIAKALGVAGDGRIALKQVLRELEAEGAIERRGRLAYSLPDTVPNVSVVVFVGHDAEGDLLGRLEGRELDDTGPLIRLAPGEGVGRRAGDALGVGDRALCRLTETAQGQAEARVIKRFARQGRRLLGVVRASPQGLRIAPIDKGERDELAVRPAEANGVSPDDLVLYAIDAERRYGLKVARILEVVGRADSAHAATVMAIYAHRIPMGFSDAELAETEALPEARPKGREDLTQIPLITIDPEDARDHDDAVWAAPDTDPKNQGGHVVIVAIADVAAYVRPGTALDRGAAMRGNSVYFPDRVVPMLPERLSTDLCSLVEGAPRPCLAVRMVFGADGVKREHRFVRGWMRSAAKLAYERAQAAIDGDPDAVAPALKAEVLEPLWAAYAALERARRARAPLEIDAPERRVRIGPDGKVAEISRRARLDAHKLIEEFMIQANVAAAETLEQRRQPLIYRIHDAPSKEKIENLAEFLPEVGFSWAKGEAATPKRFNSLLTAAAARGENVEIINEMVLRSQSQAIYDPENIGHFGLNLEKYAHFTSPIRRYADLVVHRALIAALGLGDDGARAEDDKRLPAVAEAISDAERRGMAAERDATDRYLAAFLADRVGSTFEGRVTGVTRAGLFVRLKETGADGLAPVSRLGRERFVQDARAHALIGEDTGGRFRLGLVVEVRLIEAMPITGGLLFDVLTKPEPGPRPSRSARGSGRGAPSRFDRRPRGRR